MMELGQSISIEDRMSGLFATEPLRPLRLQMKVLSSHNNPLPKIPSIKALQGGWNFRKRALFAMWPLSS
jgi:hypothetical protein